MTLEICATFCSSKGYPYLGVESGKDCYCGKKGPSSGSVEAPSSECSVSCKGDKLQKCGATNRLNVYKLARVSKSSSSSKTTSKAGVINVQGHKPTSKHTTSHSRTTLVTATAKAPSKATTSAAKAGNSKAKSTSSLKTKTKAQVKTTSKPSKTTQSTTKSTRKVLEAKKTGSARVVRI
jgi:hypothetical protein